MPKRQPTSAFMKEMSSSLQDYSLPPERAAILAKEVATLNRAVLEAATIIRFEDEPANFLVVLEREKHRATRR